MTSIRHIYLAALVGLISCTIYSEPLSITSLHKRIVGLDSDTVTRYQSLGDQLRCPTCTGLSIMQSDAMFSLQIRSAVLDLLEEGHSDKGIKDFFRQRYGEWIFRAPPTAGFHWLAWILPAILLVFALAALYFKHRKSESLRPMTRKEILDQMQDELHHYRQGFQG